MSKERKKTNKETDSNIRSKMMVARRRGGWEGIGDGD